jgi:hypothetical protein
MKPVKSIKFKIRERDYEYLAMLPTTSVSKADIGTSFHGKHIKYLGYELGEGMYYFNISKRKFRGSKKVVITDVSGFLFVDNGNGHGYATAFPCQKYVERFLGEPVKVGTVLYYNVTDEVYE